eukprot:TRINITY_DN5758_c0_g1_i1.p1 TRINITY_DN5758_c0_g1~~TRINITY_DN5758_c0_g1_i1.p1  ORF type:complete len:402 (-),score=58.58 TRINITY_DN5758_c0_g1_i1:37-1242(-)
MEKNKKATIKVLQASGLHMNRTEEFKKYREDSSKQRIQDLSKKLDLLTKLQPSTAAPNGFVKFLGTISGSTSCAKCSKSFARSRCVVCEKTFCASCIIDKSDIREHINIKPDETLQACEKCSEILNHQYSVEYKRMLTESKDQSVLNHMHLQAHTQKHNIDKLLPQYEYLVNSIVETRLGVKEEEESFGRAYEEVKLKERHLMEHFKQMQADIKEFSTLEVESGREAKILSNIKTAFADYLHASMIAFKRIKAKISRLELKVVEEVFLTIAKVYEETKTREEFTAIFGKLLLDCVRIIKRDLQDTVLNCGEDWAKYVATLGQNMSDFEKHDDGKEIVLAVKLLESSATLSEGTLIRKIAKMTKDLSQKLRTRNLLFPQTLKALDFLHKVMSDTYRKQTEWG